MTIEEALAQAGERLRAGDLAGAADGYRAILDRAPEQAAALEGLAAVEHKLGRRHRAVRLLEKAVARAPTAPTVHLELAKLRAGFGDHAAALPHFARAIELAPERAEAYSALATSQLEQRRFRDAESVARRALALDAGLTEARFTLGRALAAQGRLGEAADALRQVVAERPGAALAYVHLGVALEDPVAAAASYARALALDPNLTTLHRVLGEATRRAEGDAAAVPHLRRATELGARDSEAWALLGAALMPADRAEARSCLDRALALDPRHVGALKHRVDLLQSDGAFEESDAAVDRLIAALSERVEDVRDWHILAEVMYLDAHRALPRELAEQVARRIDAIVAGRVNAFGPLPGRTRPAGTKLRLGYLSAHFGDYPIGHVTVSLFPAHDRALFEVHGFSLLDRSAEAAPFAARHRASFDTFHDVSRLSPRAVAQAIRDADIDLLVDLDAYAGQRTAEILAYRPAPLQAVLIGHLNGLDLSCADYLITDRIVVPPGEEGLHREQIVRLADTLHCADRHPIASKPPSRKSCGLPDGAFVFGGFARPDKLNAAIVECWLRILDAVKGSVLWLSKPPAGSGVEASLAERAAAHAIDPSRLVFAERLADKAAHLARYSHCGLLLDTPVFNAASTALDALWAGVPVLAFKGDRPYSRVSASLLSALGMPELICETWADYERRAIELARASGELAALRRKLETQRLSAPLFDIDRFTRVLEAAYGQMWTRYLKGEPARGFELTPTPAQPAPPTPTKSAPTKPAPRAKAKLAPPTKATPAPRAKAKPAKRPKKR